MNIAEHWPLLVGLVVVMGLALFALRFIPKDDPASGWTDTEVIDRGDHEVVVDKSYHDQTGHYGVRRPKKRP